MSFFLMNCKLICFQRNMNGCSCTGWSDEIKQRSRIFTTIVSVNIIITVARNAKCEERRCVVATCGFACAEMLDRQITHETTQSCVRSFVRSPSCTQCPTNNGGTLGIGSCHLHVDRWSYIKNNDFMLRVQYVVIVESVRCGDAQTSNANSFTFRWMNCLFENRVWIFIFYLFHCSLTSSKIETKYICSHFWSPNLLFVCSNSESYVYIFKNNNNNHFWFLD